MGADSVRSRWAACVVAVLLGVTGGAGPAAAASAKERLQCANACGKAAAPMDRACRLDYQREARACSKQPSRSERKACKASVNQTMTSCSAASHDELRKCHASCKATP